METPWQIAKRTRDAILVDRAVTSAAIAVATEISAIEAGPAVVILATEAARVVRVVLVGQAVLAAQVESGAQVESAEGERVPWEIARVLAVDP